QYAGAPHQPWYLHTQGWERRQVNRAEEAQEYPAHKVIAFRLESGSPQDLRDAIEQAPAAREEGIRPFACRREARQVRVEPPPRGASRYVAQHAESGRRAGI